MDTLSQTSHYGLIRLKDSHPLSFAVVTMVTFYISVVLDSSVSLPTTNLLELLDIVYTFCCNLSKKGTVH